MCKQFEIARKETLDILNKNKEFKYKKLISNIESKGGVLKIAPNITVYDFLKHFEEIGYIAYIPKEKKYVKIM